MKINDDRIEGSPTEFSGLTDKGHLSNQYPANRPMEEYNMYSINVQTGVRTLVDENKLIEDYRNWLNERDRCKLNALKFFLDTVQQIVENKNK